MSVSLRLSSTRTAVAARPRSVTNRSQWAAADFSPAWVNLMNRFIFGVGLVSALLTLIGAVMLFLALP
jgi:hypothetical protein